jgi:hypothetical protein
MVFVPAPRGAYLVPVYYGIARVPALAELGAKKRHESCRLRRLAIQLYRMNRNGRAEVDSSSITGIDGAASKLPP